MSNTVDNRVVEMQFKNQDFERGIRQTITSLDGLKKALEINTNSLDLSRVQREADKLNLANVTQAVESLSERFSNLGIVGMTVMQRLTNGAINLVEKMGRLSIGQILTGGKGRAQKVADARFKLDGLLNDGEKVADVFEAASDSVSDTAFGLDEAVNIAAMLTGSGVDFERVANQASDLDVALRGIAGAAAMSNSSFEDIGRIFAQVKTAGRLMGQDMMQLQGRTINVVAELSKYLNKSQAEVQEMVHKGQIDFNTFAAAMDNSFGKQAKKSNETLQGVLANIRAALSKIGEIFYSGVIENKDLIAFLNRLKDGLNEFKDTLKPLKDPFANIIGSIGKLGSSVLGLFNIGGSQKWSSFIEMIAAAMNKVSGFIDSVTDRVNKFAEDMHLTEVTEEVKETVDDIVQATDKVKELANIIWFGDDSGRNPYGNGQTRVDALGNMYDQVQAYVNAMKEADFDMEKADQIYAQTAVANSEEVTDAKKKEMEARLGLVKVSNDSAENAERTSAAFSPLLKIFGNIAKGIMTIGRAFKKVFSANDLKKSIGQVTVHLGRVVNAFDLTEERTGKMETFFVGLFNVFKMVGDTLATLVGSGFGLLANILPTIIDGIMSFGEYIGSAMSKVKDFVESNNLLVRAGRFIVDTFTKVSDTLKEFFSRFVELPAVQKLKEEFIDIYERVGAKLIKWFGDAKTAMGDFFGSLDEADGSTMDRILGGINDALETMMSLSTDAKGSISKFFAKFKEGGDLENTAIYLEKVQAGYNGVKKTSDALSKSKSVGEFITNMRTAVGTNGSDGVFTRVKGVMDNMTKSIGKIDLAKTTLIGLSAALVGATVSFSYLSFTLTDAIKAFSIVPQQLSGLLAAMRGSFYEVTNYLKRKSLAKEITQVAIAIGVMCASIAALAIINSKYPVMPAAIAMTMLMVVFMGILSILTNITKKITSAKKFNDVMEGFSKVLLGLSGSVFLLAAALAILSEIDFKNVNAWVSLGVLVGILGALIGVTAIISKMNPQIKSSGLWLIFYAGSVWVLVSALKKLAELDVKNLKGKMKVLVEAMAIVATIALSSTFMSFGKGLAVIALVGSIILLESALKWVIKYGLKTKDIKDNFASLAIAFVGLVLLAGYMIVISRLVRKPEGVAASILTTIVAIIAITRALQKLSKIPFGKMMGSVLALTILMGVVAGLIFVIGTYGQGARIRQAGATILKVAAALALLGIVVTFLGYLDKDVVEQGFVVVSALTGLMAGLIVVTGFGGKIDPKAFIGMIGVISILAVLIALMSFIPDKLSLLESAGILGLTLLAFGTSMYLASVQAKKVAVAEIAKMIDAVFVVATMLMGIMWLSKGDYMLMLTSAASLSLALISMGECARIMVEAFTKNGLGPAKMAEVRKTMVSMMAVVAVIGLMLTAISLAAGDNIATVAVAALSMSGVLFALAGVMKVINDKIPGGANDVKKLNNKLSSLRYLLIAMGVIGGLIAVISFAAGSNWATVGMAAVAMAGLIAVLTGVYFALSKIPEGGKTMIAKAGALALMSTALIPAAVALSLLANYDWQKMIGMAFALGILVAAISGSLALLTALSKGGGFGIMLAAAGAITIVSLALAGSAYILAKAVDVIVEAIGKLAKIKYKDIDIKTLNELVGLLLKLSLTSIVTAIGIGAISAALIILGGALVVVGIGLSAILATGASLVLAINKLLTTIERMSKSSKDISDGIKLIANSMADSMKIVAVGLALAFALFVQTLKTKAIIIGESIRDFIVTVIDIISEVKTDIYRHILDGITGLFEMLEEELPELFSHLNNVILLCLAELAINASTYGLLGAVIASEFVIGLMNGLAGKADELINTATWLTMSVIKAIRDTFDNYKDILGNKFEEWLSEGSSKFYKFIGYAYGATNPVLGYEALKLSDEMKDNAKAAHRSFDDEWAALSEEMSEKNAKKFAEDQEEAISNLDYNNIKYMTQAKQREAFDHSADAKDTAADNIEALLNGTESALDMTDPDALKNKVANYFKDTIGVGTQDGYDEVKRDVIKNTQDLSEQQINAMKADGYRLNEAGTEWIKEIGKGAKESVDGKEGSDVQSYISNFLTGDNGILGSFTDFNTDLTNMSDENGNSYIDGFVNTLTSDENLNKVSRAGTTIASELDSAMNSKEGLDVNSPSKKAIKSANSYVEGLMYIMSATNNRNLSGAGVRAANAIMGSLNNALSADSTTNVFSPTIRPVLDSSNMGQYSGLMSVLDNQGTVRLAADSQISINNSTQMQLANQLNALRTDINKLANTDFSHMMDGVNINVNADTTVDGTVLRKTASNYTIRQLNQEEMGYMMATGGRY